MTDETAEDIVRSHGIGTVHRASLILIRNDDARRFIDACQKERVRILGIEGSRLVGDGVVPEMAAIGDFSDGVYDGVYDGDEEAVLHDAREFLQVVGGTDLWFDFELVKLDELRAP